MINTKFELYKLRRELKRSGISCTFKRNGTNKFGEPISDIEPISDTIDVCTVTCLYHEQNSNIQITTGETTQVRTKKIPMLLSVFDDVKDLIPGDFVVINNKKFDVTGVVNIQEWGLIGDISLEVVDNGIQN